MGKPTRLIEFTLTNGRRAWVRPDAVVAFSEVDGKNGVYVVLHIDGKDTFSIAGDGAMVRRALKDAEAIDNYVVSADKPE